MSTFGKTFKTYIKTLSDDEQEFVKRVLISFDDLMEEAKFDLHQYIYDQEIENQEIDLESPIYLAELEMCNTKQEIKDYMEEFGWEKDFLCDQCRIYRNNLKDGICKYCTKFNYYEKEQEDARAEFLANI